MNFKSILHIPTSFYIKRYINWITSDMFGCITKVQNNPYGVLGST